MPETDNNAQATVKEKKPPMSHEERIALAAKLDKELDEFIEKLPKKKYEDGWAEDRWEEEMAKHPFFMKEPPKPGDELHPLYEGLQQLKYDPDENEPEELAINYKEDGNFNFKYKNYRLAIIAYTEGIKVKCGKPEVEATLLNNRSASHFFLKNYRSALKDCELAMKIKPDYDKAIIRAANCCYEMRLYDKAIEYCDKILEKRKDDNDMLTLRKKCVAAARLKERNERKAERELKKKEKEVHDLIDEILKRGYIIEGGSKGSLSLDKLESCFPQLMHNRVFLDENKQLIWPVVFVYPEYEIMDYIQQFHETTMFQDQLLCVFQTYPEWDKHRKYTPDNLNVYFETPMKKLMKIDVTESLSSILKCKGYVIRAGTPSFIILVRDSDAEERFLKEY